MRFSHLSLAACLCLHALLVSAATKQEDVIRTILEQQAMAWNRGDLNGFVASYARHCTLVSSTISEVTREQVLAHYQQKYPSRGAMGKLIFSDITVHSLDARVATATGRWHLDRNAASGGPVGGVFSLVLEFLDGNWQIVVDHTS